MNKELTIISVACLILVTIVPITADAQLERERAIPDAPVRDIFWAPTNIGLSTVQNVAAQNLNTSVTHTFGLVRGGVSTFFGMDDGANTRLGLDYGINDRLSVGLGRMTFRRVVDIRGKYNILRQTQDGSMPIDLAVKASTGITTISGLDFEDRLSYFTSLMIARKMNRFSIQISPMFAHFNTVTGDNENQLFGLGIMANYELTDRLALSGEYLPVLGDRNTNTVDALAIAINIDTGGHVFQIFFTTSQWHNEQFIMANNQHRFWDGDFRFGFNIHRVFGLGRR